MKKQFKKLGFLLLLTSLWFSSCRKEPIQTTPAPNQVGQQGGISRTIPQNQEGTFDEQIVLGKQLANPYTVQNMLDAYQRIQADFPNIPSPVRVTHKYIKIDLANEEELSLLKQDSTIIYYPYPLDYEIAEKGTYYRTEEGQCDSCVTAQFACIKANQSLPSGISSQTLADLYIPEEDELLINDEKTEPFSEALVDKAFELVGLSPDVNPGGTDLQKSTGTKWRPGGRVTVWDDVINSYTPIEGVEVRARRWFTTHRGLTNAGGYWTADGEFKLDANYSLQWDRRHFSIRSGTYGQAWYDGPKQRGNWNLDIRPTTITIPIFGTVTLNGAQAFYARIFRAAYYYYYKDIDGLSRPPLNDNMFDPQVKIAAYNEDGPGPNGTAAPWKRFLGLGNFIKIYKPNRLTSEIYGTTIHELAHAAHWQICSPKSKYNSADDVVAESWARGVQWWLTKKTYPGYVPGYSTASGPNPDYTGVVQDMIDGISGYDQVEGYTIVQIEQAVKNHTTWVDWRVNIQNSYNNATENNLPALFNYWH